MYVEARVWSGLGERWAVDLYWFIGNMHSTSCTVTLHKMPTWFTHVLIIYEIRYRYLWCIFLLWDSYLSEIMKAKYFSILREVYIKQSIHWEFKMLSTAVSFYHLSTINKEHDRHITDNSRNTLYIYIYIYKTCLIFMCACFCICYPLYFYIFYYQCVYVYVWCRCVWCVSVVFMYVYVECIWCVCGVYVCGVFVCKCGIVSVWFMCVCMFGVLYLWVFCVYVQVCVSCVNMNVLWPLVLFFVGLRD